MEISCFTRVSVAACICLLTLGGCGGSGGGNSDASRAVTVSIVTDQRGITPAGGLRIQVRGDDATQIAETIDSQLRQALDDGLLSRYAHGSLSGNTPDGMHPASYNMRYIVLDYALNYGYDWSGNHPISLEDQVRAFEATNGGARLTSVTLLLQTETQPPG